ncbi:hypothetical protein ACIBCN_05335 [Nocardia sp. NPDC051052]|uniref:hypothetical protein n=1 Tax=Nocardia sp. NPDC051052 TaxID=3364322 RepID=UPI0037B29DA1
MPAPAGPLFGPDALVLPSGAPTFDIRVFPDARNAELAAAEQPTRYYFQPGTVLLAHRDGAPELDFSMNALAKRPRPGSPAVEYLGGTCTFATTLALPVSVPTDVLDTIMRHHHPDPPARIAHLFNYRPTAPTPQLVPVPITRNTVSCAAAHTRDIALTAQYSAEGSIEIHGHNTFLVSCDAAATEEIVQSMRNATPPPLAVTNTLTEQFDTGAASLTIDLQIDLDRLYAACVADSSVTAAAVYRAGQAADAIRHQITDAVGHPIDATLREWLDRSDALPATVFDMVAGELFDSGPNGPALKTDRAPSGSVLRQSSTLCGQISAQHTVTAEFDDLCAAVKHDIDRYLTVLDIGI